MDLLKPTPTPDPTTDDYCQPVDALKGLSLRTAEVRRSYRLSDRKMLQVRQAADGNKRSSSADRMRYSPSEMEAVHTSHTPPPPPTRNPPSHPPPDYEEPWDFRAQLRRVQSSGTRDVRVEQVPPPVPRPPAEQEYEDPWDSRIRRAISSSKPLDPLPPLPSTAPPSVKPRNGERQRSSTVHSVLPPEPTCGIDPETPLEDQPWYHGMLPRHVAEELLDAKPDFSFLVRKSETAKDSYSLSLKCTSQLDQLPYIHIKICYDNQEEGYIVGEFSKPFPTIAEAVKYYTQHKLRIRGAEHRKLILPITR